MQIDSIGEERQRFRTQLQLHASGFNVAGPGESPLFQPLGHHPKARSVPIQNLEAGPSLVRKNEQCSRARIFAQALRDHAVGDLRDMLYRGLSKSLSKQGRVDDAFLDDIVQEASLKILGKLGAFEGANHLEIRAGRTTVNAHVRGGRQ